MDDHATSLTAHTLTPFFKPRGIAVIGASHDPTKLGYGLARNLLQSNYQGAVYLVNPKGGSLMGREVYTKVANVPDPLDLAILLIPARATPLALRECGERGLKAAIISAGGFRETGAEGAALEAECLKIARAYDMRLLGPNCIGLLDTHLPMDATFLPPPGPLPGDVAFISHSGAICAVVIDWARGQGFGLSRLVSLGNQADVNETDVLESVAADPFTRVLTLYLEGVSDGRRFISEAQRITPRKPIIALKVGRSASGQRAVVSHTGALAGEERAFNAAFRRAGVIRAETSEEMFDWARALAWCPPPKGRRVAVITNAGGPGVTAADALEANGLVLARLEEKTTQALKSLLPPAASVLNPVDMLASASPEQYADCLQAVLKDAGVDSAMVILPPPPMYTAGAVAKALIPVIHSAEKPVVIALMGERLIQEAVEHFRAARIPEYRFPERAASALAVLVQRAEYLQRAAEKPRAPENVQSEQAHCLLQEFVQTLPADIKGASLPQEVASQLLKHYCIHVPEVVLARTPEEAAQLASQMGFPVVLKVASPDIAHKTDVGGVLLNVNGAEAVAEGFLQIVQNVHHARPDAHIMGVHLQRSIPSGQEVIVGVIRDAHFGPLVMFGSGGIEVEGLKDVAFALAPITDEEIEHLLNSTWAGRKLSGYRNLPRADRQAVAEALRCLGQLATDLPQIQEIEVNPLRVLPDGQGAIALDVRARLSF